MAKRPLPSPEELRQLLRYEPETGKLFWRLRGNVQWDAKFAGKEAFTCTSSAGYKQGSIHNSKFYAHRVIWAMMMGYWPVGDIDHRNRHRTDNRFSNLRPATRSENMRNTQCHQDSSSGKKGVYWEKKGRVWVAQISANGGRATLGRFPTKELADSAYRAAATNLHGEFAAAS